MTKKAVLLVSGGIDSTTCLAMASYEGYEIHAISFEYGQRNVYELTMIQQNILNYNVASHKTIKLDLSFLKNAALVDHSTAVHKYEGVEALPINIPNTYVPARNTIFLSFALSLAENIDAKAIFIGVHQDDSANYPDCREQFILAFENVANIGTSYVDKGDKLRIIAPLIKMNKAQILSQGLKLGVDYSKTISCYDPTENGVSCGKCHSCIIRIRAFAENNMRDPIKY